MAFEVKTRLLQLSLELSMAIFTECRAPSEEQKIATRDATKLSSFCDALTRYAGEAAIGRASQKRTDTLLVRWRALALYVQLRVVAEAARLECEDTLTQVLGPMPAPEKLIGGRHDPMF